MGVSQLWPPAYEVQSRVRASGVFWHGVTNQLWRPSPINPYPPQTSLDVATIGVPPPLFGPSDERRTVRGKASKTPGNNKQGASRTTHNIKQENQMKKKKAARHFLWKNTNSNHLVNPSVSCKLGKTSNQQQQASESCE
ncbi:hypothetical protein OUZ56_003990 [Daphnia magna]|uniref:Uncharacterized protein n=1 Tax=Daphnia magna TaxID=35525 RepID=A0ABQ9YNF1_9CRUS|nr:hypothetical protein OUZ56_003990 [Daphnia magna]